jgi:hypothetical protein
MPMPMISMSVVPVAAIVRGVRWVELPFGRVLGFEPVRLEAEARTRAPTRP